jgi:hypothetical protein
MTNRNSNDTDPKQRVALGTAVVPVRFGEQVIVSILYNHDANPVHHRPDLALQWMLGLLASQGIGGTESSLESAGAEERTYSLSTQLLARQDVVVMPGIALAAICYEQFVPPTEITTSITTTFTYPLLVPTKGSVEVRIEAYELPVNDGPVPGARNIQIEAFGPGISGSPVRLLRMDAVVFKAGTPPETLFEKIVAPQFGELSKTASKLPGMPSISHQTGISSEDRRRYSRIVEPGSAVQNRPISECAWQCKIPRVLTEIIERLRFTDAYQDELKAYYQGREDEKERLEAIRRYVAKERKYNWIAPAQEAARVEELASMQRHLYARQHTVFDPRCFRENGVATAAGTQMHLDLNLCEVRLRRGLHRLLTRGRLKEEPVFMGEATVLAQPMVTRELASFLCEVNYRFDTLKLFEYKR